MEKSKVLEQTPTYQLVEELKSREGVETKIVEPHSDMCVSVDGPAIVLIVID